MEEREKGIQQLERDASRLIDELSVLKREVAYYKDAATELNKTQAALARFLEQTQALTQQTHKVISTLSEIGSANILARLEAIQQTMAEHSARNRTRGLLLAIGVGLVVALQLVTLYVLRNAS